MIMPKLCSSETNCETNSPEYEGADCDDVSLSGTLDQLDARHLGCSLCPAEA